MTPRANSDVNTTPRLASSETRPRLDTPCVSTLVSTPSTIAPTKIQGLVSEPENRIADRHPRQHGVADGVAQQAHPPQHEVAAENRAARVADDAGGDRSTASQPGSRLGLRRPREPLQHQPANRGADRQVAGQRQRLRQSSDREPGEAGGRGEWRRCSCEGLLARPAAGGFQLLGELLDRRRRARARRRSRWPGSRRCRPVPGYSVRNSCHSRWPRAISTACRAPSGVSVDLLAAAVPAAHPRRPRPAFAASCRVRPGTASLKQCSRASHCARGRPCGFQLVVDRPQELPLVPLPLKSQVRQQPGQPPAASRRAARPRNSAVPVSTMIGPVGSCSNAGAEQRADETHAEAERRRRSPAACPAGRSRSGPPRRA